MIFPIPITVTIDSTAGDLENYAKFAGKDYSAIDDIGLKDFINEEDLILVVKVFAQTDEEAGGSAGDRKVSSGSILEGKDYFVDGDKATYSAGNQEYALKTIVVDHLKMTDEAYTLDLGANATQTFGFRSTNDLYVVKGDVSFDYIKNFSIRRNG